jgi:2-hydroxychromene-2-carboxylate isomerase/rhodanese-related sulfurtransferase
MSTIEKPFNSSVDFYFDLSSPYAYIAAEKVDALGARYHVQVNWKPIVLGFIFKETGGAPLTTAHPFKSSYANEDFARNAKFHRLAYRHPDVFPVLTTSAARAVLWLQQAHPEKANDFARACFRALFIDNQDTGNLEVLKRVAQTVGVSADAMAQAITEAPAKQALISLTHQALAAKVFGAPMFVFADGERQWGVDRLPQVEAKFIEMAGGKSIKAMVDEAMAQVKTLTIAQAQARLGQPDVVFVDIRDPRELEREGLVPGSVHATRGMLEFWTDPASPYYKKNFTPDKEYILYCGGGWRSALAARDLQMMGYLPNIAHIEGGFADWKKAGAPVVEKK